MWFHATCAANAAPPCPAGTNLNSALSQAKSSTAAGRRQEVEPCYRAALEDLKADDVSRRIEARTGLAWIEEERGAFGKARALLIRALADAEAIGRDTERTADVLYQLSWDEYLLGHFADSERDLLRAQSVYERALGAHHIKVTRTRNRLGAVYRDHGEYERAESVLSAALADVDRPGGDDDTLRANIYNNLAGLAYYRSDYRRAIEQYRLSAALLEKRWGETRIEVAQAANNLGLMYYEVGDYEQARYQLERALRLKTSLLGPAHSAVGSTLSNLGDLEAAGGDRERAQSDYARAEHVFSSALGARHPHVATVLVQLAILRADAGNAAGARPLLERALAIREEAFGADSNWVGEALNSLGPVWSTLGDGRKAADGTRRALGIAAASDEQELLWNAYHAYARVLARAGQLPAAAFYGKHAVNVLQAMRADLAPLEKRLPSSFLLRRESAYRELADALITFGRLAEAEQVMAMLKQQEFYDFLGLPSMPGPGGSGRVEFSTVEARHAARLESAVATLRATSQRLHAASADRADKAELAAQYRRDRARFSATVLSIDRDLAATVPHAASPSSSLRAGTHIDERTALLSYLVAPDHVQLVVQTVGAHESRALAVTPAALNRMVFEFRQALQDPKSDTLPLARELYRALILPVRSRLETYNVQSLDLSLDGALRYLPFAALHDGQNFLVESYRIELRTSVGSTSDQVASDHERVAGFGVTRSVAGFPALHRVGNELDSIVSSDRPDSHGVVPGIIVLDEAFTAERLGRELTDGYALVHVASHFVVRPGRLSESYLLLGDGNRLTLERLKRGEISFLDVRLLALSACSTAVGEPDATGAEFESLSALAGRLGAHQVLATLWPVADSSTSILMASFYRRRQQTQHDTIGALAQAQRTMLNAGDRHGPYSHPYYWAPFVIFGNDRPTGP